MLGFVIVAVIAAAVTWIALHIMSSVAYRIGLLDHPNQARKKHQQSTPLVGGIAIYSGLAAALLLSTPTTQELYFLLAGAVLIVIGGLDDRFELGVRSRLLAQLTAALIMTLGAGVVIESLGDLFGLGEIKLGLWAVPFTVFATIGVINAFNMIDGIDGLAGSLTLLALFGMGYLCWSGGQAMPTLLWVTVLALIPYLICNLQLPGGRHKKVFLGDAGSMLLGLIVVWLLVELSQQTQPVLSPVTALWLIAIPLLDTLTVMVRRLGCGLSPFHPDRRHLHHVLVRATHNARQTLLLILLMGTTLAGVGLLGQEFHVPEAVMFYGGVGLLIIYYRLLSRPWILFRQLRAPASEGTTAPRFKRTAGSFRR